MKNNLTAAGMRLILIGTLVLLFGAAAGGFWYMHRNLQAYAAEISNLNTEAKSGESNIKILEGLGNSLKERQEIIEDARSLIASNNDFPDRAVSDLLRIGSESRVNIASIEYTDLSSTGASAGTTAPAAAAPTSPTPGAPPQASSETAIPGVTKKTLAVVLQSPLPYQNLLQFIERVESNELKMQISSVSIAKGQGDNVTIQPLTVGVYVR